MVDEGNDIAISRPRRRTFVIVTAYPSGVTISRDIRGGDDGILAEVGRIAKRGLTG
jgi:hypothetical protein